jgi:outer membrane protein OmpA-like peptidoglycan-associated protein
MYFATRINCATLASIWICIGSGALAANCEPMIDKFNQAIDRGLESVAQDEADIISTSADCGNYQVPVQRRLAGLRLAAAQGLMARGRPLAEFERLLVAAEKTEVLWQASATLGEVRFGERRFTDAAQAYDHAIEIVKNETLTPVAPEKFEIEGLFMRAAEARLLAANAPSRDGQTRFVKTARNLRDGTIGGIYSRSVRGITPQVIPIPVTFEYAKTSFTPIGEQAAQELAAALKEQRPGRLRLVGHTDVRGTEETNLKLSVARAEAVATYLKQAGIDAQIDVAGVGASEPLQLIDSSGLSQEDIFALNRRVEFFRQ